MYESKCNIFGTFFGASLYQLNISDPSKNGCHVPNFIKLSCKELLEKGLYHFKYLKISYPYSIFQRYLCGAFMVKVWFY